MGCSAESVFQVYVSSSLCVQPTHFSFSFLEENLNSRIWENIIIEEKLKIWRKEIIYEDNNQNSFRMFKSYILDWMCTYRNRINNSNVRFAYLDKWVQSPDNVQGSTDKKSETDEFLELNRIENRTFSLKPH